ncbi:phosphatidylethanolamine-binding protein 4 isoform X2 [Cyprinus carpio]|uniref:Phosphatidylethanolamine-binding protein 4 isoform X2 n=1 Tax=Cyprinus carpio TaxID=7962 RepID=A0A9Q9WMH5_CYPCA|nr:phosphatidylethanolamine-binding protein 4 isoform X2 [Cyprinus carpio]
MHLFYASVVLCVLCACHMTTSTCDELLSSEDAEFCKGKLKVIYPDLVVDKCMIVPQRIREKISKEWGPPQIQLPSADEGEALQRGDISAVELSAYTRPTPPQGTGFHRYQFLIFEQPEGQSLSLSPQENSSRGNWDLQAFVERFGLARPVASVQFLTQNHKD